MTDKLPPNLLALFAPRPALRYIPPSDTAPEDRQTAPIDGITGYLDAFREYKDNAMAVDLGETQMQRRDRLKREKAEKHKEQLFEAIKTYNPKSDPQIRGDPFKTAFVSRLDWNTETRDLEKTFGQFGPIERVRIVKNTHADDNAPSSKKNRGYAFVVFEREKDMKAAVRELDNTRIRDRRVKVDYERGRTSKDWKPRRLGGGLGGRGYTKVIQKPPGPPFGGSPAGPGFRGGFQGGFRGGRFDGPPRGGGFRGGPRGGGFGGRGGVGYQGSGFPEGAPAGPRGPRGPGGGYGGGGRYDDRPNSYGSRGGYDDRDKHMSGSNAEPIRSRDRYDDRDRYGGRDDYHSRKRRHEDSYDDPRKRRY